jgi:hypothetical protein
MEIRNRRLHRRQFCVTVAVKTCREEVRGSNICWGAGNLTEVFPGFPLSLQASYGMAPTSGRNSFIPDPLDFITIDRSIHPSIYLSVCLSICLSIYLPVRIFLSRFWDRWINHQRNRGDCYKAHKCDYFSYNEIRTFMDVPVYTTIQSTASPLFPVQYSKRQKKNRGSSKFSLWSAVLRPKTQLIIEIMIYSVARWQCIYCSSQ